MHAQLDQLRDALAEAPDLKALLENPEVDSRLKADVLSRVAEGSDEVVVNSLRLIAEKGRAAELTEIVDELDVLVAELERVLDVEITTATDLSDPRSRRSSRRSRMRLAARFRPRARWIQI